MKHMLKYIFSIFFVICFSTETFAQKTSSTNTIKSSDSVRFPQRYGLRVGIDLQKLSRSFYEENYKGLELVGDYRISKKYYIAGELGNENKTLIYDNLNNTTKGTYFKVGFDYNAYENWLDMENMLYVGLRAGFGSFNQKLNSYNIYQTGNFYGLQNYTPGTEYNNLSASWLEVVSGLKAEVFNNLYVGFSLRLNYLLTSKNPTDYSNLYIPGFNKTYEGSKFGAGFNYTVSYFIPFYKSKGKANSKI